jgi:hypothetical protein
MLRTHSFCGIIDKIKPTLTKRRRKYYMTDEKRKADVAEEGAGKTRLDYLFEEYEFVNVGSLIFLIVLMVLIYIFGFPSG